jgi:hypothetical protein
MQSADSDDRAQMKMQCMDCGHRYSRPRPALAPANAVLYVAHCGCKLPLTVGAPYYLDENGKRIVPKDHH